MSQLQNVVNLQKSFIKCDPTIQKSFIKCEEGEMNSFEKLIEKAYELAWYTTCQTLINLSMKGEFEGWSGRASECWEHRFYIRSDEIMIDGKVAWPAIDVMGESLEDVSLKALQALQILQTFKEEQ